MSNALVRAVAKERGIAVEWAEALWERARTTVKEKHNLTEANGDFYYRKVTEVFRQLAESRGRVQMSTVSEIVTKLQEFMVLAVPHARDTATRMGQDFVVSAGDQIPILVSAARRYLNQPDHIIVDQLGGWASEVAVNHGVLYDGPLALAAYAVVFFHELDKHLRVGYPIRIQVNVGVAGASLENLDMANYAWVTIENRDIDPRPEIQPRHIQRTYEIQDAEMSPWDLWTIFGGQPLGAILSEGVAHLFHPVAGTGLVLTESTTPKEAVGRYGTAIFDTTFPSAIATKQDRLPRRYRYKCPNENCDSVFDTTRYKGNTYTNHCMKCNEEVLFRYIGKVK